MRGTKRVAAAVACSIAMAAPALGAGEVGDPPTFGFGICDRDLRPCTDAVILASGRRGSATIELWGMGSRLGLCHGVDTVMGRSGSGAYSCGGHGRPPRGEALRIHAFNARTAGAGSTQVYGTVRRDVKRVAVRYVRGGTVRRTGTIFNQVSGPLARSIDERPFGVFEATLPVCLDPKRIRAVAFGEAGRILGKERGPRFGRLCQGGSTGLFPRAEGPGVGERRFVR